MSIVQNLAKLREELGREKPLPFFPPLFAAFPVLSIYSANLAIVPLPDLWRPLFCSTLLCFPVWLVCSLVSKSWVRGAAAASVICPIEIFHQQAVRLFPNLDNLWQWGLIVVCLGILAGLLVSKAFWLNLVASFLLLSSVGGICWGELKAFVDVKETIVASEEATDTAPQTLPDIFYIILDGYGREDAVKRVMGVDTSFFVDGLRQDGFYVASDSHSNYVQTEISLSSSLNYDLIPNLLPKIDRKSSDRAPLDALISNNAVARFLRTKGYRTFAITSGFPALRFPFADIWLKEASSTTLFETTLLQMTAFVDTDKTTGMQYRWRRATLLGALRNVDEIGEPEARPKFVFAHILAPHPPFVFGPNGEQVAHHGPFGYLDGSDYMDYNGDRQTYRVGYSGQVVYLSKIVMETVSKLIAENPEAIVLIQGDHGSKLGLDQERLDRTDVNECFDNLSAYRVPSSVRAKLYSSITPVNSFRIILSTLFGAKLPKYPDRSWYSPFGMPYSFTDITAHLNKSKT